MRTPRLRAAWVTLTGTGAAASVALGLLVFASVLASLAIPRESVALRTVALHRVIASSAPADRTVVGTADAMFLGGNLTVQATDITAVGASLRTRLAASGVPIAGDAPAWADLTTNYVSVQGTAPVTGHGLPQAELTYSTALARHSRVVAGRLPASGQAEQQTVVQVAVTTATAARFGLRVGTRLRAGPAPVVVTGIIRPTDPASVFWTQNDLAASPVLSSGSSDQPPSWASAFFIGPGELPLVQSDLEPSDMQVSWVYAVRLGDLTADRASGLDAILATMASAGVTFTARGYVAPITAAVTSQLPAVLSPFVAAEDAAVPVLGLLDVSLAVLGTVVVMLGARLVAQRRAAEFTLMRARGAALYQLGWLVLRANLVIAAAAGLAAGGLALGLTPGGGDAVGWWLAGLTIAAALVGPVLISVVPQRVASSAAVRRERWAGGRKHRARRIVVETVLLALAVGGLVVLRDEGVGSGRNGLYASAAPVLIAVGVAVVVLRGYPALARQLARLAGLSRGVVAFVGLARATRTPPGAVLPSFALVLVLAMVAFPDMISTSVNRAQVAASWQQVGADAVIAVKPPLEGIPLALQQQISSMPGVLATATAAAETGSLPSGSTLSVVYVDPARYAAVVDRAPGPRFPLAALSGSAAAGLPALANAAAAPLMSTAPADVSLGSGTIAIRLAGRIGAVPAATTDAAVLVPQDPAGDSPAAVNLMLVAGPRLDAARLTAAVRQVLPDASVTVRSSVLAALRSAPVLRAAQTALAQGLAAAAGFGVLVLLLSLLLTAQTRELTLASLATMGLRRWQAQLLLAAETLPPVVAAAIGGVACAWLLAPLVGPALNLAEYSGTGSAIVVTPAVFPLAASAAGLVLVALLVLAGQAVITYYRGSARALRIAD